MHYSISPSRHVLEPIDRVSEVLFGLIMVLTFTGSLSVSQEGKAEIHTMLVGALGCNLAWGLIDGVFYLMACLADYGKGVRALHTLAKVDAAHGQRILADFLPPMLASLVKPEELEQLRLRLLAMPEPPARARLSLEDWRGAWRVALIVFLSTFPVVLPFVFMTDAALALRVSNAIAIVLLFLMGYAFGRITGHRPWLRGLAMVLLGAGLVAITMALGG